jgi:6,7-dimethyl-8-ribityllumazine synthase
VNASGTVTAEYAGVITLGTLVSGTQVYYQTVSGGSTTDFVLAGVVNQAVQVYNSTGPVDTRSYLKLFARKQ